MYWQNAKKILTFFEDNTTLNPSPGKPANNNNNNNNNNNMKTLLILIIAALASSCATDPAGYVIGLTISPSNTHESTKAYKYLTK